MNICTALIRLQYSLLIEYVRVGSASAANVQGCLCQIGKSLFWGGEVVCKSECSNCYLQTQSDG